jgi:hypothetical protein
VANNRVFYAITAVGIGPHSGANAGTYTRVRGLQSATITTNYNLEAAYELGMLSLYQNIEGVPEIEVQLERVLDGTPLMFDLATSGRVNNTLIGRANSRCNLVLSVHADTAVSASGTPVAQCLVSGAYASAISFKSAMDGNATESMTVVGNNKIWASGGSYWTPNAPASESPTAASGIVRRQHVLMDDCIFPKVIPGVDSGTGKLTDIPGSGYSAHIQSVSINCNLGREQLMELGRKGPFFRYVKFPVEVTAEFEVLTQSGDFTQANDGNADQLNDESIHIFFADGTDIDLGDKCKLQSANYSGGGTDGANRTVTYSFRTFNDLTVNKVAL